MLKEGKTKKEICAALGIKPRTYYTDIVAIKAAGIIEQTSKVIKRVRNTANKITASISNLIKEAVDNFRKISENEMDMENNVLEQFEKVKRNC